ncbi:LysE family translocator [Roseovarius faecimaris]|uniref:LysE family translocator n=1 Tax=Roseovarius faecimaris TaxID=2494550 RepID=A0A6I6IKB3_9RHOB|nr:LysE family translocator [Roseovarius faecimaris]QGX97289.1 LysE family translocator [Roseovarius faecimaris]
MTDIAPYLPGILAAYAILAVGAASPGPAVAMLLGISSGQGRAPALVTCLGIATGSATINVLTMLGVGLLISQAAWAMTLLKLVGSAYLLWLAWGAFRKALNPPQVQAISVTRQPAPQLFAKGYLLQVTNPKAIAFWLAIAAIGAVEGAELPIIAVFVLGAWLLSFTLHGAWAVFLSSGPVRAAYASGRGWIEGALGAFFTFAAFKIATSES